MIVTGTYRDKEFGACDIVRDARARRVRIKAVDGRLRIIMPRYAVLPDVMLRRFIDENRPRLRVMLQKSSSRLERRHFVEGKEIAFGDGHIRFVATETIGAGRVRVVDEGSGEYRLEYHRGDAIDSPALSQAISRFLLRWAVAEARKALPPLVAEVSDEVGVHPSGVRIGRGRRILGHCSRQRVITLSAYVMFLPRHLRRYIVCHELAHLTHFDHSPAFHDLCNSYCGGREKELRAELRNVEFPICV